MPQKSWAVGEEVLAADFNTYMQNQVVPQFTNVAQRDSQWSAPPTGAMCVTVDTNALWYRTSGGAWVARNSILNVSGTLQPAARIRAGSTSGTTTATGALNITISPALGSTIMSIVGASGGAYGFIVSWNIASIVPGGTVPQAILFNPNGTAVNAQAVVLNWIIVDIP